MRQQKPHFGKKGRKHVESTLGEKDIGRFAGSSDEEDESDRETNELDANDETGGMGSESEEGDESDGDRSEDDESDQPYVSNYAPDDTDPQQKMAGVMAKILGTSASSVKTSSVVLGKTTTPLQRLQRKEKEKIKALKEKRQANRERNLSALHIPLSVATSMQVDEGRLSISKELEQERLYRRVATRGVVALFNAIAQHQHSTEDAEITTKKKDDTTKMTKHGFLDKIKNAAASIDTTTKRKPKDDEKNKPSEGWSALKDDFMMNPKKKWDEESSEDDGSDLAEPEDIPDISEMTSKNHKRRKIGALE